MGIPFDWARRGERIAGIKNREWRWAGIATSKDFLAVASQLFRRSRENAFNSEGQFELALRLRSSGAALERTIRSGFETRLRISESVKN
jgi:hypothetical protein